MGREHRVVSALASTAGPGRPDRRLLHGRVGQRRALLRDGVRRGPDPAPARRRREPSTRPSRRAIGERVVDTLVEIHAVDPDAVGLGELGKQGGLRRPPAAPLAGAVGGLEDARAPARRGGPRPARRADPRAGSGDDRPRRLPARQHDPRPTPARSRRSSTGSSARSATRSPTSACCSSTGARRATSSRRCSSRRRWRPASPPATTLKARYAERSGRDLAEIDYYVALGYWKLAIILEGVYSRYARASTASPKTASRSSARTSSASPRPPTSVAPR